MAFQVFLYRVFTRCIVTNAYGAITARATVMFFFVDDLSMENRSCGGIAQTGINVVSGIQTFRTTDRNEIGSGYTCRVASVDDFTANDVCTCARFTGFNRRFIYSISSYESRFSQGRRFIASSDKEGRSIICNACARRIISVRGRNILYGAFPSERITYFFPMRVDGK